MKYLLGHKDYCVCVEHDAASHHQNIHCNRPCTQVWYAECSHDTGNVTDANLECRAVRVFRVADLINLKTVLAYNGFGNVAEACEPRRMTWVEVQYSYQCGRLRKVPQNNVAVFSRPEVSITAIRQDTSPSKHTISHQETHPSICPTCRKNDSWAFPTQKHNLFFTQITKQILKQIINKVSSVYRISRSTITSSAGRRWQFTHILSNCFIQ